MNSTVPWLVARKGIHLGYDYQQDEPTQFDFISNIDRDDLKTLVMYATLQRHYEQEQEELLDWSDIIKLALLELDYRTFNKIK